MPEDIKTQEITEDTPSNRHIILFGVNFSEIECFRSSLLTGYVGAAVGGIATFLYTSKFATSCHAAFASYWVTATCSWVSCRYDKFKRERLWNNEKLLHKNKLKKDNEYNIPDFLNEKDEKNESDKNS